MIVSDFTTIIQKRGQISGITYVLPKEKWTRMDLKKLATSKHFNNMDFWMSPSLDAKSALEMTGADIDYFWKSLVMPKLDDNPPCSKKEFMGGVRNGTCIMWSNPSPQIVDSVLNDFKKLASSLKFPIEEF